MRRYFSALHLLKLLSLGQVLHGLVNVDSLFVEKLLLLLGSTIHRILRLLVLVRLLMREVDIWLLATPLSLHCLIRLVPSLLLHLLRVFLVLLRRLHMNRFQILLNLSHCPLFVVNVPIVSPFHIRGLFRVHSR